MPVAVDSRAKEPIAFELLEGSAGVTGATLRYDVSRVAGGVFQYLDFTGLTFKAPADVTTRYRALAPVDAVNAPGVYADATGGLDLPAITNRTIPLPGTPLVYAVTFYQTAPTVRILDSDEIRAGVEDTIRRRTTNKRVLSAVGDESLYADDGVTVEATTTYTDVNGDPITVEAGNPARATAES